LSSERYRNVIVVRGSSLTVFYEATVTSARNPRLHNPRRSRFAPFLLYNRSASRRQLGLGRKMFVEQVGKSRIAPHRREFLAHRKPLAGADWVDFGRPPKERRPLGRLALDDQELGQAAAGMERAGIELERAPEGPLGALGLADRRQGDPEVIPT